VSTFIAIDQGYMTRGIRPEAIQWWLYFAATTEKDEEGNPPRDSIMVISFGREETEQRHTGPSADAWYDILRRHSWVDTMATTNADSLLPDDRPGG